MSLPEPVTQTLPSRIEAIDGAEEAIRHYAASAGFDEGDQYFIGLAAREVLVNAIRHGNRFDAGKQVLLGLAAADEQLTIEICDEGDGFQLADVADPLAPENLEKRSGRGVRMAMSIMDTFEVDRREPRGTSVRMTKRMV
ncbi:MAG: ATP-binding protein [Bryobacterales bacterium]|nr:ATP-binding protein [Bryobacterales bacterium]